MKLHPRNNFNKKVEHLPIIGLVLIHSIDILNALTCEILECVQFNTNVKKIGHKSNALFRKIDNPLRLNSYQEQHN